MTSSSTTTTATTSKLQSLNNTSFGKFKSNQETTTIIDIESLPLDEIPKEFQNLLERCLNHNPSLRPDFTTIVTSIN